eukprot:1252647-Rhodomonas_salina.2
MMWCQRMLMLCIEPAPTHRTSPHAHTHSACALTREERRAGPQTRLVEHTLGEHTPYGSSRGSKGQRGHTGHMGHVGQRGHMGHMVHMDHMGHAGHAGHVGGS